AWIATCGIVYLLGFYTGKGTQERRLGAEERIVRLPVTSKPPPEGQRPKAENEFVFYDKLMGERPGRETVVAPAEKTAAGDPAAKPTPPPVDAPRAPAPSHPATRAPEKPATPPPAGAVASRAPTTPAPPVAVASRPPTTPTGSPTAAPKTTDAVPRPGAEGGWTVLANPTRSRDEADGLLRQLRTRGYDATLVRVLRDGDTWYRVQVGRFTSADQASEVMRRLREREGVTHAFVASE